MLSVQNRALVPYIISVSSGTKCLRKFSTSFTNWQVSFGTIRNSFPTAPAALKLYYCTVKSTPPYESPILKEFGNQNQGEEEDFEDKRKRSWRNMKLALITFGVTSTCLSSYLITQLGQPSREENGTVIRDEFSHLPIWQQYLKRSLRELDYYRRLIKEPSRDKLLPDVMKYPYYQPPYTLVLELTDVLVHPDWTYKTGWRFKKRPGIDQFLERVSGLYEIVVYTAEQGMTVFPIIEALDPNNHITYKLVRDSTHFVNGHHVKNLDKLNRDLSKVIVIDWNAESVKFHQNNCFKLERWKGNDDDTSLLDLASFLTTVAQSEVADVRNVLHYYKQFDKPLEVFREKQREFIELQEQEGKTDHEVPVVKRYVPNFFK